MSSSSNHMAAFMAPFSKLALLAISLPLASLVATSTEAIELGLPIDCALGENCFFQQFVDVDLSSKAVDPFCSAYTYDKHKGTDLRIRSMADVVSGFAVTAVADGMVMRLRDGEADHLVKTEDDFESVAGKECGNGLVLRLAEDYEIQYCHLRKGSLVVAPGQAVQIGDKLGEVGASGLAQFPHVHITLRKGGKLVDPLTGRSVSSGCNREFDKSRSLFSKSVVAKVDPTVPDILSLGLSGQPVRHSSLVEMGPPPKLGANDSLFVAWGWLTRLNKGDRLRIALKNNRAETIIDNTSEPLERNKATYSAYAGKRQRLPKGSYTVTLSVLRQDEVVASKSEVIVLE